MTTNRQQEISTQSEELGNFGPAKAGWNLEIVAIVNLFRVRFLISNQFH